MIKVVNRVRRDGMPNKKRKILYLSCVNNLFKMKEAVLGNVINFGKTLPLFLSALVLFPVCAAAQQIKANDVIGRWVTENGDIEIEFYLTADGTYAGKIVRLADPLEKDGTPKKDHKNPDKSLRSRPVVGIVFMQNVTFDPGKGRWNIEIGRAHV